MTRRQVTAKALADALWLGRSPDDEVWQVATELVTMSRWESGRRVSCFSAEHGHVFDLVFNKTGSIVRLDPGADVTPAVVELLEERAKTAFSADADDVIWRDVLFGMPEVLGCWRYGDQWQIVPAPPEAPRLSYVMGEHPFLLEHRVRGSANPWLTQSRRFKQLWQVHMLLSLLLRGSVNREWPEHPKHWVVVGPPEEGGTWRSEYLQEGYMVGGGFIFKTTAFSDTSEVAPLAVIPDDDYYARRGIEADDAMDVPEGLEVFIDRFRAASPKLQDQLLRACYWRHVAYRVWHTSKSASFVAAINSIESLLPTKRVGHICPECGNWHDSPGPTARFRTFLETFAASESEGARSQMYQLRSNFVHGGELHAFDLPRSMSGLLVPASEEHRDLHDTALAVSRTAIRSWFLATTAGGERVLVH